MSEPLQQTLFDATELPSMSSAEGSLVKMSVLPEQALDWLGNAADFGSNTGASFARYDHNSCSWRTWQSCLVEEWTRYSERWPRLGMTQSGEAFKLPRLERLIPGTASGLLPTPAARDWKDTGSPAEYRRKSPTLAALMMLPTPRKSRGYTAYGNPGYPPSLTQCLTGLDGPANNGLRPDPAFVEWMMGYPIGWTELAPSETP